MEKLTRKARFLLLTESLVEGCRQSGTPLAPLVRGERALLSP